VEDVLGSSCCRQPQLLNGVEQRWLLACRHRFLRRQEVAVEWPDGTIAARSEFHHVPVRDVLYKRILPGVERAAAAGVTEEAAYGEHALEIAAEPGCTLNGRTGEAGGISEAAENACRRTAFTEARELQGAGASRRPDPSRRGRSEVMLRIGLGGAAIATFGWGAPEAGDHCGRGALLHELGDAPRLFPSLWGLWIFFQDEAR
jgi:hypothetical protein